MRRSHRRSPIDAEDFAYPGFAERRGRLRLSWTKNNSIITYIYTPLLVYFLEKINDMKKNLVVNVLETLKEQLILSPEKKFVRFKIDDDSLKKLTNDYKLIIQEVGENMIDVKTDNLAIKNGILTINGIHHKKSNN